MRIKQIGDPILRQISQPVSERDFANGTVNETLAVMMQILDGIKQISDENGNAISAPQVGNLLRIILLRVDGEFIPIINPEFTYKSETTFLFEEECFSFYSMRAKVMRHERVSVKYEDVGQIQHSKSFEGEFSGLIQHEIDHLDGIFFMDRVQNPETIRSIDYIYKDNPERLSVVREMCEYMSSS